MSNYYVSGIADNSGKHNLFVTDVSANGAYGGIGLGNTDVNNAYARLSATVDGLNVSSKAVTLDASGYSLKISDQGYTFTNHAGKLNQVASTFYTGGIVATLDNAGNLVADTNFHLSLDQMRKDVCDNHIKIVTLKERADTIDISFNTFKNDQDGKNLSFRTDICGAQSDINTLKNRVDDIDGSYNDFTKDVQTTILNFTDNINNVNNSVTMIESQFGTHMLNQAKAINKIAKVFDGLGFMKDKLLDTTGIYDDTGAKAMVAEFRVSPGPNPGALTDNSSGNNLTTYNYRTNKGITTQIGLNQDSNGNVYIIQPTSYANPGTATNYKPAGNWNFGGFSCTINAGDGSIENVDLSAYSEIAGLTFPNLSHNANDRPPIKTLLQNMWNDIDTYGNYNSLISSNNQGKPTSLPALVLNSNMPSEMYNMTDLGTNVDLSNKSIGLTTSVTVGIKTFIITNIKSKTAIVTWQTPSSPSYAVSDPFTINGGAYNVYKVSGGYLSANKNITYAYRGFKDNTLSSKVTITTIPATSVNIQSAVITSSPTLALSSYAMSTNNVYEGTIKQGNTSVTFKLFSQGSNVYGFNGKGQSPAFTFDVYNGNIVNNTVSTNMSTIFSTGMSKSNPITVMYTAQPLITNTLIVDSTQKPTSYSFTLYGNGAQLSKVGPSGISGNPPTTDHLVIV